MNSDRTPPYLDTYLHYRKVFSIFSIFFLRNFSVFHIYLFFFIPNMGNLANLIFLLLENFMISDRTPPYLDTYLQLFPNFGNSGEKSLP